MELEINFPKSMIIEPLIIQKNIPTLMRVSDIFEIVFPEGVFLLEEIIGRIYGWDFKKLEERIIPWGGGKYSYFGYSLISFKRIEGNRYKVIDLSMFDTDLGWCQILENEEYAEPSEYMRKAALL